MRRALLGIGVLGLALLLSGCAGLLQHQGVRDNPAIGDTFVGSVSFERPKPSSIGEALIQGEYIEGRIVIGFTDEKALEDLIEAVNDRIAEDEGLEGYLEIIDAFYIGDLGVALVGLHGISVPEALGIVVVVLKELDLTDTFAKGLPTPPEKNSPPPREGPSGRKEASKWRRKIVFVEPDYVFHLIDPEPQEAIWTQSAEPKVYDPYADLRPYQWGLDAVGAEAAWERARGDGIVVAVLDTGVDGTHKDLVGQLVTGYDPLADTTIDPGASQDHHGHGTHVAGIIAAKDDGEGIVGLAPEAKIMPIPIFQPWFIGTYYTAHGIKWAVDNGADVLNNSWGGGAYSQALKAAFDYALANGVVVVCAAGNDGEAWWHYPSAYPGMIAVGASAPHGERADFSQLGTWLSVVAPGTGILSSVPTWYVQAGTGDPLFYDYWGGTSMATPFVAALAALLRELHPAASPYQIKKIIENTAVDIEAPGFDTESGYGLIDASAATIASLPPDGAALRIHVVTESSYDLWPEPWPVVMMDVILRKDGRDVYLGQTDSEGQSNIGYPVGDYGGGEGLAFFPAIDPGEYEIIVGGNDCTWWWNWYRTANRVVARSTVTLAPGTVTTVDVPVNTELKVTVSWSGGTSGTDIDLAIYEPNVGWAFAWSPGSWGVWSSDAMGPSGTEWYELIVPHYDDAEYYILVKCWSGSADVTVTIEQNGVTETYSFPVDTTGGYWGSYYVGSGWYLTWDFPGWWDWTLGAWVF